MCVHVHVLDSHLLKDRIFFWFIFVLHMVPGRVRSPIKMPSEDYSEMDKCL